MYKKLTENCFERTIVKITDNTVCLFIRSKAKEVIFLFSSVAESILIRTCIYAVSILLLMIKLMCKKKKIFLIFGSEQTEQQLNKTKGE